MKKIFLLFAVLSLSLSGIGAQTDSTSQPITTQKDTIAISDGSSNVLGDFLEYVVNRNKKKEKKKSYKGWSAEAYTGFGFVAGNLENSDAGITHGASYSVDFGVKTIYRVNGIYALTFNTGFMHNRYKIKDGVANNITGNVMAATPANFVTNSECFRTWGFGLSFGNRFNFCKTRDTGNYLELSVYGNYTYSRNYIISYEGENDASATVFYKNSNLFHPFEAGAQVNLGFHWLNVWGRYRFTNWFDVAQTAVKLPRFVIGLGVTL
ncbi:MAG: hypothetical protein LBH91_04430 [Prevotellaceae bacterium]|jgi:hypothetical protein|nr:hypothetical protein [Prevotellaceae bacterium]